MAWTLMLCLLPSGVNDYVATVTVIALFRFLAYPGGAGWCAKQP